MNPNQRFNWKAYALALLSVFAATILTQILEPVLAPTILPFFFAAVAISSWYGGLKPGVLATALAIGSVNIFFPLPANLLIGFWLGDFIRFGVFFFVAVIISLLTSNLQWARQKVEQLGDRRLQQREEQLRLALQAAGMGMWDWNLVTGEINWTAEHEQIFGFAPGTFDGRYETFNAFVYPGDRQKLQQVVQTAIQQRTIYQYEYRIIWPDGSIHWVEGRGQTFDDDAGKAVRMTGTIANIDDRKQAEEAIRRSEERYRSLVSATFQIVWTKDAEGKNTSISPSWFELTGQPRDEFHSWSWVDYLHPDDRDRALQAWQQAIASQSLYETQCRFRAKDGSYRDFLARGVPVLNPDGSTREWIGTCTDITQQEIAERDRQRAEAELNRLNAELEQRIAERTVQLERSSELLNSFFNAASSGAIGLCIHDKDYQFVQINQALADINGYPVEAHIGKPVRELLPELAPTLEPIFHQVFTTKQPILNLEIATTVPSQPDIMRYWLASYFPMLETDSGVEAIGVIVIEISDRKQAEASLSWLAAIVESSDDAIVSQSLDGTILSWNAAAERLFGYTAAEIVGQSISLLVPPDCANEVPQALQKIRQGKQVEHYETVRVRKDRQLIDISATVSPIRDATGKIVAASAIKRNISDRKQAEAILRESDRRWRSLLDNVQLIVVGLDQNGNVEYVNPFFLQLTGYTPEEVLGKYWFDSFLMPSQKNSVQACFQEMLKKDFHPHYQNSIVTKLGQERTIAWSNTLLQDAKGEAIGTISIGEDITERDQLERMKAEFLSIVSHELRTPLTSISGALELLSTGLIQPESERGKETIQIAATEADRLIRLVNDILDLERLESGKIRLEYQSWDLAELMRRAVDFMQLAANEAEITLSVQPLSVVLEMDGDRILQVLTNLLSNAIKFSPHHSTIWLTAEIFSTPAPYILITVRDRGRGIPQTQLESIFERFQQVDASDSRKKGGTGLGLAICRSIVQQHGGHIWVESTLDEGSSFHFTLPLSLKNQESHAKTDSAD